MAILTVEQHAENAYAMRQDVLMLDDGQVKLVAVEAATYLAAYCELSAFIGGDSGQEVSLATPITNSEWSICKPLFDLMLEREQALRMEAGAVSGLRQFGRTSSEVESMIADARAAMQLAAFVPMITTI